MSCSALSLEKKDEQSWETESCETKKLLTMKGIVPEAILLAPASRSWRELQRTDLQIIT